MQCILYFVIALAATTVGAMTGMGGGVIIKPVLDILGDFNVATIGVLSSVTVLLMSLVAVGKQICQKAKFDVRMALFLSIGSVIGGNVGQRILSGIITKFAVNQVVLVIQNALLALLIVCVFFFMLCKAKIPTHRMHGAVAVLSVGAVLGVISSFLGIGGGPINVALLILVFSLPTKTATLYSIITILFAQASKLVSIALGSGFAAYDLSLLPALAIGGIFGGFIGSKLNKTLPERTVEYAFNGVQVVVFCICIFNIAVNL